MDYFYCPPAQISHSSLVIEGDEFSHLVHVMRKKVGDEIRVVDGQGTAYDVRLDELKKKTARGTIFAIHQNHHEPAVNVTLAVGILKNPSKFDFLVEKATEIGVNEFIPLLTERTIPAHAKVDRWRKLALAAMKQCGRSRLPQIRELTTLSDLLESGRPFNRKLIAHEQPVPGERGEQRQSGELSLTDGESAIILVGPEGGFSDEEVARCLLAGYKPVYLGERRMRTETAAVVMAAACLLSSPI